MADIPEEARLTDEEIAITLYGDPKYATYDIDSQDRKLLQAQLLKSIPIIEKQAREKLIEEIFREIEEYLTEEIHQCDEGMKRMSAESPQSAEAYKAYKIYHTERTAYKRTLNRVQGFKEKHLGGKLKAILNYDRSNH